MTGFSWDFGENSDEKWKFHASQRFFLCQKMYKNQGVWFVKCLKNDRFFLDRCQIMTKQNLQNTCI